MISKRNGGFTLIELMIVVAVIAILSAIAIPLFNDQVRKSRRAAAISNLQDAQLKLEKWRVDHANYTGSAAQPANSTYYTYTITADAASPANYTITATPQGGQASDTCGTLSIQKAGAAVTKSPSSVRCW